MLKVPVVSSSGKPLMPCHQARARELVRKNKAKRRFKNGIFYIQLLNREDGNLQEIAVGIDPGSKKEAFTVKSKKHTYLNVQVDAVTHVKDALETKRNMRRNRRFRKTPCRKTRSNRSCLSKSGKIPPSTKARWDLKLRIINILRKIYPITTYVIEDIKARTKEGKRAWNASFSPLEQGKRYFYDIIKTYGNLVLKAGHQTAEMRNGAGLAKTKEKLSDVFEAHCVDSWVLANSHVGGHVVPENKQIFYLSPLRFHRRQLHVLQPGKGGKRKEYGSTRSMGFTRGSLVKHKKYGICYIGGKSLLRGKHSRISIHAIDSSKRISQNVKAKDIEILCYNNFRMRTNFAKRFDCFYKHGPII